MKNNYAVNGGLFYLIDKSPLNVKSSTFDTSTALDKGGIAYI